MTTKPESRHRDTAVVLTKHHGLGNDFLIALEPTRQLTSSDAKQWCDRRTGIGADGLIQAHRSVGGSGGGTDDGSDWTMVLWNADGSRAEISGNGIRCLGQAIGRHTSTVEPRTIRVATDAGQRELVVRPSPGDTWSVRVGMGAAAVGPEVSGAWSAAGIDVAHQQGVDIGNPHLVAVVSDDKTFDDADMAHVGPIIEAGYPGGINVHLIRVGDRHNLDLKVWERGAGVTQACGSGACASSWAAHRMDLVDTEITVTMPGGSTTVELTSSECFLTGPASYIGSIVLG